MSRATHDDWGSPYQQTISLLLILGGSLVVICYVTFHESKRAEELIRSKLEFEDFASCYQVKIKNIWADNEVYIAKPFQDSCACSQQNLTFCAVGAHWQNGIMEWLIGSITQCALTILLHAMSWWPSIVLENMWTFAICHAVTFHNGSIWRSKPKSPYKLFTGQLPPWSINGFRAFGCPDCMLKKKLQGGDSFSKWKARGWQGMHVGQSSCHVSSIP